MPRQMEIIPRPQGLVTSVLFEFHFPALPQQQPVTCGSCIDVLQVTAPIRAPRLCLDLQGLRVGMISRCQIS